MELPLDLLRGLRWRDASCSSPSTLHSSATVGQCDMTSGESASRRLASMAKSEFTSARLRLHQIIVARAKPDGPHTRCRLKGEEVPPRKKRRMCGCICHWRSLLY